VAEWQPAGYSGTPLPRKLGIKPGHRVLLVQAPRGLALAPLPAGVKVERRAGPPPYDVLVAFAKDRAALDRELVRAIPLMHESSALWVAWPKRASHQQTDLDENGVRDTGLAAGLVDVKVCAIDDVWSGLKLVYRLADRAGLASARPTVSSTQANTSDS